MTGRRLPFRLLALILTFGVAALPAPLFASGFQLVEQNASGLGNAFAGQAAGVKNASAIYFNPAALTRVKGWNLVASVEPIGVGTTFTNCGVDRPLGRRRAVPGAPRKRGRQRRQVDPRAERLPVGPGGRAGLGRRRLQRAVRARDQLARGPLDGPLPRDEVEGRRPTTSTRRSRSRSATPSRSASARTGST